MYCLTFSHDIFITCVIVVFNDVQVILSAEHRALALRAAEESIVLLRNEPVKTSLGDSPLLPLADTLKPGARVAVIGPAANDTYRVLGVLHVSLALLVSYQLQGVGVRMRSITKELFFHELMKSLAIRLSAYYGALVLPTQLPHQAITMAAAMVRGGR